MIEYVNIGLLIPSTLPLAIVDSFIVVVKVVKMLEVDPGLKISENLTLTIADKELMLMGEVNIGLIPATLLSTT